jgi:hypothetical protein
MAAVNFPVSPVDGETFTYEVKTFTWNNIKSIWVRTPTSGVVSGSPTIPSVLTDLSIVDGTVGQVLTTDGTGGFTFADTVSVLTDLSIVDGTAGQVLTTDGAGGFTFESGADQSNFATTGKAIAMAIVFGG